MISLVKSCFTCARIASEDVVKRRDLGLDSSTADKMKGKEQDIIMFRLIIKIKKYEC